MGDKGGMGVGNSEFGIGGNRGWGGIEAGGKTGARCSHYVLSILTLFPKASESYPKHPKLPPNALLAVRSGFELIADGSDAAGFNF